MNSPSETVALPTLYNLTDAILAVSSALVENGGELTPELEAQLAQAEGRFDEKAERVALMVRHLTVTGNAVKEEVDRLEKLMRSRLNAADRLKRYLLQEMQRADRDKVETDIVRLRVLLTPRPIIRWCQPVDAIPEAFRRVVISLDGDAAYEAWKNRGGHLPEGFSVEQGHHLRIA